MQVSRPKRHKPPGRRCGKPGSPISVGQRRCSGLGVRWVGQGREAAGISLGHGGDAVAANDSCRGRRRMRERTQACAAIRAARQTECHGLPQTSAGVRCCLPAGRRARTTALPGDDAAGGCFASLWWGEDQRMADARMGVGSTSLRELQEAAGEEQPSQPVAVCFSAACEGS